MSLCSCHFSLFGSFFVVRRDEVATRKNLPLATPTHVKSLPPPRTLPLQLPSAAVVQKSNNINSSETASGATAASTAPITNNNCVAAVENSHNINRGDTPKTTILIATRLLLVPPLPKPTTIVLPLSKETTILIEASSGAAAVLSHGILEHHHI